MRRIWIRTMLLCAIAIVLAAPVGHAQPSVAGLDLRSGLMTFAGGRTAIRVTVTEVGVSGRPVSGVRIMLLDDTDRVLFQRDATMQPGQPARASFRLEPFAGTFVQARMIVLINFEGGTGHAPVTVLEHVDADSLTIIPRVSCAPPAGRVDPVTLAKCDGLVVNQILTGG